MGFLSGNGQDDGVKAREGSYSTKWRDKNLTRREVWIEQGGGGDKGNLHHLKVPMCKGEKSGEIGGEKSEITPHFLLNMC